MKGPATGAWVPGLFVAFLFILMQSGGLDAYPKDKCPACNTWVEERAAFCPKCLQAITWPDIPASPRFSEVISRTGRDAFIRGPNDIHPQHKFEDNAGGDMIGPIGTYHFSSGLRYLVRFDVPEAFVRTGVPLASFVPEQVLLVLRMVDEPDARDDVPIIVYPLTTPFREGEGRWGKHHGLAFGCTWTHASFNLLWKRAGGDYAEYPYAEGVLPRRDQGEVEIDVTGIYEKIFDDFRQTGVWVDNGLIIMRNQNRPGRGLYRLIYSFEAAPPTGISLKPRQVLSPELIFR